jgi:hypothetical protein
MESQSSCDQRTITTTAAPAALPRSSRAARVARMERCKPCSSSCRRRRTTRGSSSPWPRRDGAFVLPTRAGETMAHLRLLALMCREEWGTTTPREALPAWFHAPPLPPTRRATAPPRAGRAWTSFQPDGCVPWRSHGITSGKGPRVADGREACARCTPCRIREKAATPVDGLDTAADAYSPPGTAGGGETGERGRTGCTARRGTRVPGGRAHWHGGLMQATTSDWARARRGPTQLRPARPC